MSDNRTFGLIGVSLVTVALGAGCESTQQNPAKESVPLHGLRPDQRADKQQRELTDNEKNIQLMKIYFNGVELLEKGEVATAMLEFDHCIQLNPSFAPAYFKRSHCYFRQERYAAEIKELEECVRIEPTYLEAWLNLGHAYLAQERLDEAKRCYLRVIDLDANHPIAHYNVGLIYFDLGQFDESAKHLRHALDMGEMLKPDLREKAQHYLKRCEARG